jgi:hypothetical protein
MKAVRLDGAADPQAAGMDGARLAQCRMRP